MTFITRIKFIHFYAISMLPMFILYMVSDFAFVVFYYLIKYRRRVVYNNLKKSFPHKSEQEIKVIEKKFYRHFCDTWIESLKGLTSSKKELKKRVTIKNPELIQRYYDENRSIILYAAHQGNWEFLSLLSLYIPHQLTSFYQPLSNGYFEQYLKIIRERFGMICIESNKGYRAIVGFAERNVLTVNILAGDQSPQKDGAKHWVQFLNRKTAFLVGAARIAKKSNQVVVFPSFTKKRRGYYEVEFKVIEDEANTKGTSEIIDSYAGLLEETIINSPELWLWSHRRWKLN